MVNGTHSSDSSPKVPVRLTERERILLLGDDVIPDSLKVPLRFALVSGMDFEVQYTLTELGRLAGYAGALAEEGAAENTAREWETIARKVIEAGNDYVGSLPPGTAPEGLTDEAVAADAAAITREFFETLPPEVAEEVTGILERETFTSFEEFEARVMGAIDGFNNRPYEGFAGLTPYEMDRLINSEWDAVDSGMWLDRDLPLEDVSGTWFFRNARIVLRAIQESGGVKATARGNLPRKFVNEMLDRLRLRRSDVEALREGSKAINEADVLPLYILRVLLRELNYIRKHKGKFLVTKGGAACLEDNLSTAPILYMRLFETFFTRIDLACFDPGPDLPRIQETVPYILYRLRDAAKDWRATDDLAEEAFIDLVKEEIRESIPGIGIGWALKSRVLDPLVEFGLLKARLVAGEEDAPAMPEYRKTDLYDRFLKFEVGASGEEG